LESDQEDLENKLVSTKVLSVAISKKEAIVKKWQNLFKIIKKQATIESNYITTKVIKTG
jgi:hypothetical protein